MGNDWNGLLFRLIGSDCVPRWKRESNYLRFIHGFVQSASQLVFQTVIILKGVHIHSLQQLVQVVQDVWSKPEVEAGSVTEAVSSFLQDKPLAWYDTTIRKEFLCAHVHWYSNYLHKSRVLNLLPARHMTWPHISYLIGTGDSFKWPAWWLASCRCFRPWSCSTSGRREGILFTD